MSDQPIILRDSTPEALVSRRHYWPVATLVILALNVLIFLLVALQGGFTNVFRLAGEATNVDVLLDFGASYAPYIRRGEYWRLVMPMFLHAGVLHLAVNSYALYLLGRILEEVYGYGRFALLYVGTGIGGAFLSMTRSNNVAVGASGAIFGIAGAMLVTGYWHHAVVPRRWGRAFGKGILPFIVLNLIFGALFPRIDNWAHLGGLVSGIVLALLIPPPGHNYVPGSVDEEPSQAILAVPVAVVALAMAATAGHYRTSRTVTHLLEQGALFRTARQTDRALERFREAARLAPRNERPHEELGLLYLEQNRAPEAIQEYNEALRLSPDSQRAQLGLAQAYQQKGDLAKARKFYEAVLGKNPQDAEGQAALADLCAEQKLYPEAIQHYQEALRRAPDMVVAHNNLAWLYATSEDPHYRNPQEALQHARRAVELTNWKVAEFIDTLAEASYANGNFQEAVKVQAKALELAPRNQEYKEHMARYRRAAGV